MAHPKMNRRSMTTRPRKLYPITLLPSQDTATCLNASATSMLLTLRYEAVAKRRLMYKILPTQCLEKWPNFTGRAGSKSVSALKRVDDCWQSNHKSCMIPVLASKGIQPPRGGPAGFLESMSYLSRENDRPPSLNVVVYLTDNVTMEWREATVVAKCSVA